MTYIGQQPSTTFDSGIQDRFTGLSSNTVTLTHDISAETDILVVWNNIVQDSGTYSVGGTGNKTLTLGGTLVSADVVTVYYLNKVMQSVNPTAGSVNTDQLATNAVTNLKMADDAIGVAELSATGTASSSTYLRGDNSWAAAGGDNTPAFIVGRTGGQLNVNNNTYTKLEFDNEILDTDSAFASNKFTAPSAGKYQFIAGCGTAPPGNGTRVGIAFYKNGSIQEHGRVRDADGNTGSDVMINSTVIFSLSASDYVEVYVRHNKGSDLAFYDSNMYFAGYKLIGL